jgi:hypothetical protein
MQPNVAQSPFAQAQYSQPNAVRQNLSRPGVQHPAPFHFFTSRSVMPPSKVLHSTNNQSNVPQMQYSQREMLRPESSNPIVSPPNATQPLATPRDVAPPIVAQRDTLPPVVSRQPLPPTNHPAMGLPPTERPVQATTMIPGAKTQLDRPAIIFRPAIPAVIGRENSLLRPDVRDDQRLKSENLPSLRQAQHHEHRNLQVPPQTRFTPNTQPESDYSNFAVVEDEIPPPAAADDSAEYITDEPPMQPGYPEPCAPQMHSPASPLAEFWYTLLANLNGPRAVPAGVGPENVMNAPFFIDTTQPLNNCRIRLDAGKNWEFPDRAEYFWAKTPNGLGPQADFNQGEPDVDYQDIRFYIERGSDRFSVGTELPIRSVDPELRLNTTGFADMNLTTKALLLDGKCWQLTQVFRTFFPTGSARRGTGNGHFSLEPGVAARYKWSDITYFHADLSYWFPLGGDLDQAGQILNAGIGVSHVCIDTDTYAVIPTLEIDSATVLDGTQTPPVFNPVPIEIDTLSVVTIHPGVRIVCDKGCDCGTKEFGITGGVAVTEDHWYESMIRIEFRWTY